MRILLTISCSLDPDSGAAGSTLRLGQEYTQLGHEVSFFTYSDLPKALPDAIKMVAFPELAARHILGRCRQGAIDVVDSPCGEGWLYSKALSTRKKARPLLVTRSHGLEATLHHCYLDAAQKGSLKLSWKYFLYRGSWRLWEEAISLRNADLVFLLNREDAKYATERLNVRSEKIHIVPNGIPDSLIDLPKAAIFNGYSETLQIAQIGSYIQRKGIQYTVPALQTILRRFSHVKITLLGTGCPEETVYKDFEPELHARIQVIPQYSLDSLPRLLQNHQIKLFTPLNEGFGKVLLEAMACGLAPVVSAAGGPLEVVRDGYDALVIPIGDSLAVERALEQLITDPTYLEKIRHNAYATAQNYRWKTVANKRLSLYQKAIVELQSETMLAASKGHQSHQSSAR